MDSCIDGEWKLGFSSTAYKDLYLFIFISLCTDPESNLDQIQEVSDWVLKAKLPLSLATLRRKLEELKDLAANLPDSTAVLNEADPQLDAARKLLEEAQDARYCADPHTHHNITLLHLIKSYAYL